MKKPRIKNIKIDWSVEDDAYIASCEHKNLIAINKSPEKVVKELHIAAELYFSDPYFKEKK